VLEACVSLFASPHLHFHDLGFLLIPFLGLVVIAGNKEQNGTGNDSVPALAHPRKGFNMKPIHWAAFLLAASLLMLFADLWDPARYTVPYLLMAILPMAAWKLEKLQTEKQFYSS
jgi:hypothetical protein